MTPIDPVRRLPEKTTRANALGCGRYVPTRARFGKGHPWAFSDFVTARIGEMDPKLAAGAEFGAKGAPGRSVPRHYVSRNPPSTVTTLPVM